MAKIIKDKKLIEKFLTRGVENIYPDVAALRKKLMSGERLRVYQGFDPTGPYLHIGHAIGIRALKILQQLGHEVIFLIGDFTSKVGDPDKDTSRKILSDKEIEKNMAGWKKQAAQLINFTGDNAVKFKRNYEWLSKLKLENLINLMSKITAQSILQRNMFKRRIKKDDPIFLHELIYPLIQGYDGVVMKVDMEIAGTDQIFNMLVGRDLSRAYLKKERFIRTNKMMDAPDGRTMSKTRGNGINLGDTSEDMYGKAMSYPDSAIITGLELLTDIPEKDIKDIENQIKKGVNPLPFKKLMAYEIIKIIRGQAEAKKAENHFMKTVQKKETPGEVGSKKLGVKSKNIIDLLVEVKLVDSRGEARRLIAQNGIKVDGKTINNIGKEVKITKKGILLQRGKRRFIKVIN